MLSRSPQPYGAGLTAGAAHGRRCPVPVSQPIVDVRTVIVHAHEALICGPVGSLLQSPDAMLRAAHDEGLVYELGLLCLHAAMRRWGELRQTGRLLLNVSATAQARPVEAGGGLTLSQLMRSLIVLTRMVVLDIIEHERVLDVDAPVEMARVLHSVGRSLALGDFGDGRSSLCLWAQVRPDIIKI
ncbi:MAG: EAL domain-containing protein, partial [Pseudomonadota bacterium]